MTALIEAAERYGADAIVVGCEPHSRLRRALGVLTDELLEHSPVAVIAVPLGAASLDGNHPTVPAEGESIQPEAGGEYRRHLLTLHRRD